MKIKINLAENYKKLYERGPENLLSLYFLSDKNILNKVEDIDFSNFENRYKKFLKYVDTYFSYTAPFITCFIKKPLDEINIYIVPANVKKGGMLGTTLSSLKKGYISETYVAAPFEEPYAYSEDEIAKKIAWNICHESIHQVFNMSKERDAFLNFTIKEGTLNFAQFRDLHEYTTESLICGQSLGLVHESLGSLPFIPEGNRKERLLKVSDLIDEIKKFRGERLFPELNEEFMQFLIDWYKQNILTQKRG